MPGSCYPGDFVSIDFKRGVPYNRQDGEAQAQKEGRHKKAEGNQDQC